jgi:acetoin utilization protein AcuB
VSPKAVSRKSDKVARKAPKATARKTPKPVARKAPKPAAHKAPKPVARKPSTGDTKKPTVAPAKPTARPAPVEPVRIRDHMTAHPHTVGQEQMMAFAHALMRKHAIRHLPVLHAGKVVGMVSTRDLHLVETLPDVDPEHTSVEEAMSTDVYIVAPEALLTEVAEVMAARKLGSAVVIDHGGVVGVFTTTDALHALAKALAV